MQMLGLDLGTSYIKGGILDLAQRQITHVTRHPFPEPAHGLPPHHHEVDPQAVVAATQELLHDLAAHAPDCTGILTSSQMHGFLLTDRQGMPLTPLITWLDQRALAPRDAPGNDNPATIPFTELEARLQPEAIVEMGNGFKAGLPLCTLYAMARSGALPDNTQASVVWSLSDYVMARLGGGGIADAAAQTRMEPTIAASMGAYDFAQGNWRWQTLAELGLDHLIWPAIAAAGKTVGTLEIGGKSVPVYPALGDHQCATLGSLLQPGELALNISTGSQVSLLTDGWTPSTDYESRPYFAGRTLNTVTRVPAGRSLTGLVQLLTEIPRRQGVEPADPWQTIAHAITETDSTDLEVNLSFFGGAFGATGSISRMTEANMTIGHLFRAAFEHMAHNYAQCAAWLNWPVAGEPRRLVFAGGLAQRFEPLRAEVATRLQADYRMSPHPEDTLFGLLALGLVFTGLAPNLDEAIVQLKQLS